MEGYIDWRKGDLDSALLKFKAANDIKMDSSLVLAYTQALMAKGRYDEANKLAMDLIAKSKDFGPIYDVLYVEYIRRNLPAEAEKIRRLKADNNPKNLEFRLQLAAHYYLLNRPDETSRIIEATARRQADLSECPREGRRLLPDVSAITTRPSPITVAA